MNERTIIRVWLFIVFALVASTVILATIANTEAAQNIKSQKYGEGVYYTRFGGMYCGAAEVTPCGITLTKCTDEKVYLCMHDLATKQEYLKE